MLARGPLLLCTAIGAAVLYVSAICAVAWCGFAAWQAWLRWRER